MIKAASLHPASQSFLDRRLPDTNRSCTPGGRFAATSFKCDGLLDGRAKQTMFRNPRFARPSTTLEPMKPAAPVTNTGSSCEITYELSIPTFKVDSAKITPFPDATSNLL